MAEARLRPRHLGAERARRPQRPVPGEGAEGDDHPAARQQLQLALQVGQAVVALLGGRLVGRRRAADDGGDVGVAQPQPVAAPLGLGLVGEAGPVQRRVEPLAGAVAGEHPPGPVGAVGGRRQADDRDPRGGVAEAVQRPRPVVLAAVATRRVGGARLAPLDQPRAAPAGVDLRRQPLQRLAAPQAHRLRRDSMTPNRIMRGRRGAPRPSSPCSSRRSRRSPWPPVGEAAGDDSSIAAEKSADAEVLNEILARQTAAVSAYDQTMHALRGRCPDRRPSLPRPGTGTRRRDSEGAARARRRGRAGDGNDRQRRRQDEGRTASASSTSWKARRSRRS